jgi:L-alanine-DL-glutamate epimerase-like enolase superfamily enzyme
MKLTYQLIELPLEFTFAISRGSKDIAKTIIVKLEAEYQGSNYITYGEAVFSKFYGEDEHSVSAFYEQVIADQILDDLDPLNLGEFEKRINRYEKNMSAKAGLDIALYDLRSKIKNLPLYKFLGLSAHKAPKTSYTIGLADLETMKMKTMTALDRGYDVLKIKLGTSDDVKIVKMIRELAPKARIRLDANAAWQVDDALAVLEEIKDLNIEFVEEPLRLDSSPKDYEKLYRKSPLPLMADESCHTSKDMEHCARYFHSINIKHTKCGGITEALRMIKEARNYKLKIMLGCFCETSISIAAFCHISPLVDYADLDGSLLLKNDPYKIELFKANQITLPSAPGLGYIG